MKKIALITGATSGIGRATAFRLAELGHDLILAGRNQQALGEIEKELEAKFESKILLRSFDIRVYKEVEEALVITLPKEWRNIEILINSAGLGLNFCPIHEGQIEDWDNMVDTNIKGLLYVTRLISMGMVDRKLGHIINIGSTVSRGGAMPNVNVYAATKYAIDGLSKGMRADLQPHGIHVTQILPGRVKTGFGLVSFKGNEQKTDENYNQFTPLDVENVVDAIVYALSQPQAVNIQDISISSQQQV